MPARRTVPPFPRRDVGGGSAPVKMKSAGRVSGGAAGQARGAAQHHVHGARARAGKGSHSPLAVQAGRPAAQVQSLPGQAAVEAATLPGWAAPQGLKRLGVRRARMLKARLDWRTSGSAGKKHGAQKDVEGTRDQVVAVYANRLSLYTRGCVVCALDRPLHPLAVHSTHRRRGRAHVWGAGALMPPQHAAPARRAMEKGSRW